jgi:hypothetical protein
MHVKRLPTFSVGKLCVQPVDKRLRALQHKRVKKFGEFFAKKYFQIFTGENFTTPDYEGISEALPTTSVGKLCVQPVDKRLHALWHKRVNKIGEKITKNIYMADWRKIHQSY